MKLSPAMVFVLSLGASSFSLAAEELLVDPLAIPPGSQTPATPPPVMDKRPENEVVVKFSHVAAPDTPKGKAAERFKQLAEQYTNSRVRVEIYPSSLLYQEHTEIEALQSGAVQMLAPSLSTFAAIGVREFNLFDLPYIFPNREILHRVMDGDVGKSLFRKLSAKGLAGLAYWDNGFKQMSSNRAMRKVADLKGLKLGIQPSKVLEAQMKALGASPQQMAVGEVYSALQQGITDGAEYPVSDFYTQKLHEVQKHLTISNHGYLGYAVIANKKFWDDLPADIRDALMLAMKEATLFERDLAQQENDAALGYVIAANTTEVHILSPNERTAWHRTLLPVYQEFENVIGNYLIRSVGHTAAQVKQELGAAKPKGKAAAKK